MSRPVKVRETIDKVRVYLKHKLVAEHRHEHEGARAIVVDKARRTFGRRPSKSIGTPVIPEEKTLRAAALELDRLVALIRKEGRGRPLRHIPKLYRFYIDYPTDALLKAVSRALEYGLASSILRKAMENGYRGSFIKAQDLFEEILADRSTRRLINHLANIDLLLIDEMGYLNLTKKQANIFFRLMEERYNRKFTTTTTTMIIIIITTTTNLDYDEWYDFLGNKKMAEALLSSLRHHCKTIRINGPPLRRPDEEPSEPKSLRKKINEGKKS